MKTYITESLKKSAFSKSNQLESLFTFRNTGPRTTVVSSNDSQIQMNTQKRTNQIEAFKQFTQRIIPKMEENIEFNLLKNHLSKETNQQIVDMISQAYERRRIMIYSNRDEIDKFEEVQDIFSSTEKETYDIYSKVDIVNHDENDIGLYNIFDNADLEKYYSKGVYGPYINQEYMYTDKLGIMCTEEGLKIVTALGRIKAQNKIDYSQFLSNNQDKIQETLKDEELYFQIFHDFSKSLIDASSKYRNKTALLRLYSNPQIFDILVSIIVNELGNLNLNKYLVDKNKRLEIMDQVLAQCLKCEEQYINPSKPKPFLQELKQLNVNIENNQHVIDLTSYFKNPFQLPENLVNYGIPHFKGFNSSILVHGDQGTGKSGVLLYTSLWAHKSGWVVLNIPNCYELTQSSTIIHRHNKTGLFLQYDLTKSLLESFRTANKELFEKIPVNLSLYGKFGHSGLHENDVEATPNLYDSERKVYWKEHEKFHYAEEEQYMADNDRNMDALTMGSLLKEPKNLLELIDFGIKNEELSICALYELLEQLYNCDTVCTLISIDEYNWLYKPSNYRSFRYANDKGLKSKIPPYHLSLTRAFMNFDGHKIKNGFKICASNISRLHKHEFGPKQIMLPRYGYDVQMQGLALNDYRNALEYYYQNGLWKPSDRDQYLHQQFWMESQGNWSQTLKSITYQMRA